MNYLRQGATTRRFLFLACILALSVPASGQPLQGWRYAGNIDHDTFGIDKTVDGDINIDGKIDGGSQVTLRGNKGSIIIHGKVDGVSVVRHWAKLDIVIGTEGGSGDRKIDGGSKVYAWAGRVFRVGNKIDEGELQTGITVVRAIAG